MKRIFITLVPILIFTAVFSCSETVDVITFETPQVSEEGERELTIEVIDTEDIVVTGYDIAIDGPTSVSESNIKNSQYILDDLQTGTYSILVTKDGYVKAETVAEVELPEGAASGFSSDVLMVLTKKSPPVKVKNNQDSIVETAPSGNPGEEGLTTSLNISAGTFPENVVNDDETVDLSLTRSTPNNFIQSNGRTVDDMILFEPEGTNLNKKIEISIPIEIPEELGDNLQYVLMPGNIPVELSEDSQPNKISINATRMSAVNRGNVEIEFLGEYYLEANIESETHETFTEPVVLARSGCGEGISAEYSVEIAPPGPAIRRFAIGLGKNSRTVTKSFSKNGVGGLRITIKAQHKTKSIRLMDSAGRTILSETMNMPVIQFFIETSNCHNSGGGSS